MRKSIGSTLAVLACLTSALVAPSVAQGVHQVQDRLVSDDPANFTPNVLNGSVKAIQQVGNLILIGGDFTQIQEDGSTTTLARSNLAAFDATTGKVSTTFVPQPDGEVTTIIPAGDGTTVYIGGYFNNVAAGPSASLARINATTGQRVSGFRPAKLNGRIKDLRLAGGRLWIAGLFSTVAGVAHPALATLNPATGALDPYMNLSIAGTHNGGVPTVMKMDVTPSGSHLLAIGNFRTVAGAARQQAFMLNLTGPAAALENWQTNFYTTPCSSVFQTYMRDLDISPDGQYAVISTTGAYSGATYACDTSARFDLGVRGSALAPRWINSTGGDTQYAVAITGTAVYVGGHARWQNNPHSGSAAAQGAVSRLGIAALDPVNGLPLSWNPTRERGVGVFDLMPTPTGLWVGSDTAHIGQQFERHERIAFFPLAGGTQIQPVLETTLPNDVYRAGARPATTDDTVSRTAYNAASPGTRTTIPNGALAWRNSRGAFMLNGQLYTGWSNGDFTKRTFDGTTFGPAVPVDGGDKLVRMTEWHNEVAQMSGMAYDSASGRIYYTVTGSAGLYYRYFTPQSDVVGALRFLATGNVAGVDLSRVNGMFFAGGSLYWASSADGVLRRSPWNPVTGVPSGTPVAVSGPAQDGKDWRARSLFLFQDPSGNGPYFNQAPVATASVACTGLSCTYSAAGSQDPDGSIASYAWTFGDGGTATGPTAAHDYQAAGDYPVVLTVTDDRGATDTATATAAAVNPAAAVTFVGGHSQNANAAQFTVTVPAAVAAGDTLLLFLADNDPLPTVTGPAGWTLVQSAESTNQSGRLWSRTATAADAGSQVQVSMSALVKADLTLLAYRGTATPAVVASAAGSETVTRTTHTTPTVTSPVFGGWLVSYWGEKSSTTTSLTVPGGVTARAATTGLGTGRVTAAAGDSGGPVPQGTAGAVTATADTASARVLMFSVILAPAA